MATATKERAGLTIGAGTLLAALSDVTRAVSSRGPKPILRNVRIGDGLITGTDLEIRIDREIGEQCEPMLLPADRLTAILRACRHDDDVTLTPKGSTVTIRCGRGKWDLPTEDAAEYPTWEPVDATPVCRLPADQFVRAIRAVSYATDSESSRYALGAVMLDCQPTESGSMQHWVGTDGRRLACVQTESEQATDPSLTLVPAAAARIAATLSERSEGSVQIEATKSDVVFTFDGGVLTARIVDGRFPKWRDVFPEATNEPHVVEREELLSATRAAAVVASEQSKGVLYDFGETLTLTARSSEYGESKAKCSVVQAGTACKVKLDPVFVRDYLTGLPADEEPNVSIHATGPAGAVTLSCGEYRGVIMPLAEDA
jgi:DNA polymerase-3 subunit beta